MKTIGCRGTLFSDKPIYRAYIHMNYLCIYNHLYVYMYILTGGSTNIPLTLGNQLFFLAINGTEAYSYWCLAGNRLVLLGNILTGNHGFYH